MRSANLLITNYTLVFNYLLILVLSVTIPASCTLRSTAVFVLFSNLNHFLKKQGRKLNIKYLKRIRFSTGIYLFVRTITDLFIVRVPNEVQ